MREDFNKVCKNQKLVLVLTFSIAFAILVLSYAGFQQNNINNMRRIMIAHEKISVEAQAHILQKELVYINDNLEFLYNAPTFRNYINGESKKSIVENEWVVFVNSMKKYDKLRYIDSKGNEIVRINYNNGQAKIIEDAFLQNKINKYYFIEAMAYSDSKIYVSKFDLAIENNMFGAPVNAIIRVAIPVFDRANTKCGIILIDYLAEVALHEIKQANNINRRMQLVDNEGYWLVGPNEYGEGRAAIYPEGGDTSFIGKFPVEWNLIKKEHNGYFFTSNGIFTFKKLNLASDMLHHSLQQDNFFNGDSLGIKDSFIISRIPASIEPYANEKDSFVLSIENIFHTKLLLVEIILSALFLAILVGFYTEYEEKTKIALAYDRLTGCFNRVFGTEVIEKEIKKADKEQRPLSLIMLDLDHFKKINDKYGHPIGDVVLKTVAKIANNLIRKNDRLIRLGGEEFLILLPEAKEAYAYETAEKIRVAMANYIHPMVGQVTASFGVGERVKSEIFHHWYERIDAALYRAKSSGRNKVIISSEQDHLIFVSKQLEWKNSWESGNKKIDVQHLNLVKTCNRLVQFSLSGVEDEVIIKNLEVLLEDISNHFKDEEQVLSNIGYSEYEKHVKIHKELLLKAQMLKEAYQAGEAKPSALISFVVSDVALGHMMEEDIKYFPFLNL